MGDGTEAAAAGAEAGDGHTHESACLNCGARLVGEYCHACGQKAHVHRTLGAFGHDLLHGVFHFEGKIWHTLPMLAWRPGELTRRYIAGERARFVSPMALFLFSVFLMFAVFSFTGNTLIGAGGSGESRQEEMRELRQLDQAIAGLERQRAEAAARGADVATIDAQLNQARTARAATAVLTGQSATIRNDVNTGWARLDKGIRKANENPQLLFYKLQTSAYKFSWALIPISLPFLWLLFLHRPRYRRHGAYDHVVFVTYSISFVTLMVILLSILTAIGMPGAWLTLALLLVTPVHMYRQLRGAYLLSWFSALWRTALLALFAILSSTIFLLLLVALGVLG